MILTLANLYDIGPQLKKARLKRGWTLREVTERTHIATPAICKIENSVCLPRLDTLAVLGDALGFQTEFMEAKR